MKDLVRSMGFEYGDALFRLYQFQISSSVDVIEHPTLHEHRFFELHFALDGSCVYSVDGKSIILSKGNLIILPPDTPHIAVNPETDGYAFSVLSFALTRAEGDEGCFSCFENALLAAAKAPIKMTSSLTYLVNELGEISPYRSPLDMCLYKAKAGEFIYELFELLSGNGTDAELKTLPDKENVLVLLEELVNQPGRTLSEIADAIHYSTRQTSRLIHSVYGMSLSDVRKHQRAKGIDTYD